MSKNITRRELLGAAGVAAAGAVVPGAMGTQTSQAKPSKIKVLGVSCSPRPGKTTAQSVQVVLDSVEQAAPIVETELLDLGGMKIGGWAGGSKPGTETIPKDDFTKLLPKLKDPAVMGLVIGSPVYFRSMSSLCKAFLEQCAALRKPKLLLADKPVGVLAVGAFRNGGQELTIEQIQTAMLCHEAFIVGGKPRAHQGATLWNAGGGDVMNDDFGKETAKLLGIRIAEAVMKLAGYENID